VVVGQAQKFAKKLEEACAKKTPLILQGAEELTEDSAKLLAEQYGRAIADAMAQNQTIGPYNVMSQFTKRLGGDFQAHHILEVNQAIALELTTELDNIPSVILTRAKHDEFNALFRAFRGKIKSRAALWDLYAAAYKDYPHWLEAIKPYFGK